MDTTTIAAVAGLSGVVVAVLANVAVVSYQSGRVKEAIKGIHHRLDRLNGSVQKHEQKLSRHGERLASLDGGDWRES